MLTDDKNGDALFVDDIFSALGDRSRLSQINEIRAGDGDDVVDMTSFRYNYAGNGVKIYGGLGDDTIWSNNGNNILFGDAGNDRIVGGSGTDYIIGGSGNDSMHGGGGNDFFCFGSDWGIDTVEQLYDGTVTLWFKDDCNGWWDESNMTFTDGTNQVKISGVSSGNIRFYFGNLDTSAVGAGAFTDSVSEKIFEDKNKGMLA